MIGKQILNYQIRAKIGEGGMGTVYLGQHTQLQRMAAIKALHPNLVNNPSVRQRFKNEAATLAHLRHPYIVSLYDYYESPDGLFLIMEYVDGRPLDKYIEQVSGPIPESRAIRIFMKILDGFAYAHQQGVIHRDIKPSNLIISPEEDVKILDFGIAKLLDAQNQQLTKTGSRMGTVIYMSPEQVKGEKADARSDIYSLGVTFFQMITGRSPYDQSHSTEYEVYHQIVNHPLPQASLFYPNVSAHAQQILERATAKNPMERFQNCDEFRNALIGENIFNPALASTQTLGPDFQYERSNPPEPPEPNYPASREEKNTTLLLLLVLFFITGCILFVIFNPMDLAPLRRFQLFDKKQEQAEALLLEDQRVYVKQLLADFYESVETHDFTLIRPFYRDMVDNYFDNYNRSLDPDIKAAYQIYWNTYSSERHEIDWASLEYDQDELGNHQASFAMTYFFQTKNREWQQLSILTEILFDQNWKIYSIRRIKKEEGEEEME